MANDFAPRWLSANNQFFRPITTLLISRSLMLLCVPCKGTVDSSV